ncbi:MAG: hypothetical protein WBA93_13645 [Microcoleaceae cyanobacterium]
MQYSRSLTDFEWEIIEPLLPKNKEEENQATKMEPQRNRIWYLVSTKEWL